MTTKREKNKPSEIPKEEKRRLRKKTNSFISRYCGFAALIIILITFAAFILGEADGFYSQCGIMISIALLAISVINDPDRSDPDKADSDNCDKVSSDDRGNSNGSDSSNFGAKND